MLRPELRTKRSGVRIPSGVPCKDDYFDTMGIEVIVLIFLPKTAENSGFLNTFEKGTASDLAEIRAGGGAFLLF